MKITSYLSVAKFASSPTELNYLIEAFVNGLDEIAIAISSIGQSAIDLAAEGSAPIKTVASRLEDQSSKFFKIMQRVVEVNGLYDSIKTTVASKSLMSFDEYDASRLNINNNSRFIEEAINIEKTLLKKGSPHKEAYDQMTQVTIEYVGLVRRFNECVAAYRKLHNITDVAFKDADVGLSIFRLKSDVSNLPSVNQAPENSDVNRGYKK